MRTPSDRMVRVLLKDASARSVYNQLRDRGFHVKHEVLDDMRSQMVALGQALPLRDRYFSVQPKALRPTEPDGSRGLLKRQLLTGQHSLRDPQRVAELLQDLAA